MLSGRQPRSRRDPREEVLRSIDPTLKVFERYSNYFQNGMPRLRRAPYIPLFQPLKGIPNLLGTFSVALIHDLFKEEWNPFNQRQLMLKVVEAKDSFSISFQTLEESLRSLLLCVHESLHVALWEPFFTGNFKIPGKHEFKLMSLCFEAFCFWYADVIATPLFRKCFPDNEFVFQRNAISDRHFHPGRAFAAVGITDVNKILDIYMVAFCGGQTPLSPPKDVFSYNLARRIYEFHFAAKAPLFAFYDQLSEVGVFSEFRSRFCAIEGIPSIFPEELNCSLDPTVIPFQYCRSVYKKGLPFLETASKTDITRIRVRRYIQSRAYFSFVLRKVLKDDNFICLKGVQKNAGRNLLSSTEIYLERLEHALRLFCMNKNLTASVAQIMAADLCFSKQVVTKAKSKELWVARRTSIIPPVDQAFLTGLLKSQKLSPKVREREAARLRKYFAKALFKGKLDFDSVIIDRLARMLPDLCFAKAKRSKKTSPAGMLPDRQFVEIYNEILSRREIIREWGAPLYGIDPARNQFQELLFIYV